MQRHRHLPLQPLQRRHLFVAATASTRPRRPGRVRLVHALHVAARAERPARAGHHEHPDVGVVGEHRQRPSEAGVHRVGQRIASLRPVERDHAEVPVDVREQVVGPGLDLSCHPASMTRATWHDPRVPTPRATPTTTQPPRNHHDTCPMTRDRRPVTTRRVRRPCTGRHARRTFDPWVGGATWQRWRRRASLR